MSEFQADSRIPRRRFLKGVVATTLPLLGGSVWAGSYRFGKSYHKKTLPRLKEPLKVVHLSDLHFGRWVKDKHLARWVDASLAEQPDLILITGDLTDHTTPALEPLINELSRLKATTGVYGVWGNHDYDQGHSFRDELRDGLRQAGTQILQNEGLSLRDDLYLAGIDDLWHGKPDLPEALSLCSDDQVCLLMAHIPDILPDVPGNVDVTFCGHTHGGQVKLPLIGAVTTSSAYGKRFLEGWIKEPVTAYVSRGLGMVTLPIRFLSQAEIAVFEFLPEG